MLRKQSEQESDRWTDADVPFIPEACMLQTDRWRAESSRQSIQGLPVGDDPLPPLTW